MKTNYLKHSLIILFAAITVSGLILGITALKSPEVRTYSMNWTDQQNSFEEAYQNSDLVVIGKIKSTEVYEEKMVVFTMTEIETTNVLKGALGTSCKVLFTGGTLNGITYRSEEVKIPSEDGVYMFLLKSREIKNEYIPIGGYQGVFELDITQNKTKSVADDVKIKEFNLNNKLEKSVTHKNIKDLIK